MKVPVEVEAIAIDPEGNSPIVILKEQGGERSLPIWIGLMEATAIATELEKISFERPMTHDLCIHILEAISCTLTEIEVTDLRDNTFFAVLRIERAGEIAEIDARPSDAIALALRAGANIYVNSNVFDSIEAQDDAKEQYIKEGGVSSEKQRLAELLERLDPEAFKYKM